MLLSPFTYPIKMFLTVSDITIFAFIPTNIIISDSYILIITDFFYFIKGCILSKMHHNFAHTRYFYTIITFAVVKSPDFFVTKKDGHISQLNANIFLILMICTFAQKQTGKPLHIPWIDDWNRRHCHIRTILILALLKTVPNVKDRKHGWFLIE